MASVLQVEELRGSTTGANANKIIIPSGQTLDITDWSPPTGTVLQVQTFTFEPSPTYDSSVSSNSYVDSGFGSVDITPQLSGSKIYVVMSGWAKHVNPSSSNVGGNFKIYRSVAGGSYSAVSTNSQDFIYKSTGSNWEDQSGYAQYLDTPTYTEGQQISYKLYGCKSPNGNNTRFYHGGGHVEADYNVIIFTAMEIAG